MRVDIVAGGATGPGGEGPPRRAGRPDLGRPSRKGRTPRPRRTLGRLVRPVAEEALMLSAATIGTFTVADTESMDAHTGNAKVWAKKQISTVPGWVDSALPGSPGGTPESSWFDGSASGRGDAARDAVLAGHSDHLPEVTLGVPGGEDELDECDGTFIEMVALPGTGWGT